MAATPFPQRVAAVRRFNRFYTKQIGLLHEHLLRSPFSLTEARVLYELAHHTTTTATELGKELGLDAGYLSRILRRFQQRGVLDRTPSKTDARQSVLSLTPRGREAFAELNRDSHHDIAALLRTLPQPEQQRLVAAMHAIEGLLGTGSEHVAPYVLRRPRPGDMGWVIQRHGALYAREYGWGEEFEALVADIVAKFIGHHDRERERCWIAELDGENVGRCFASRKRRRSPGCVCSSSSPGRAGSVSGSASWRNAWASPARSTTAGSRCGQTTCCMPPAASTNRPASTWCTKSRTTASVTTWWERPGTCSCEASPRSRKELPLANL